MLSGVWATGGHSIREALTIHCARCARKEEKQVWLGRQGRKNPRCAGNRWVAGVQKGRLWKFKRLVERGGEAGRGQTRDAG